MPPPHGRGGARRRRVAVTHAPGLLATSLVHPRPPRRRHRDPAASGARRSVPRAPPSTRGGVSRLSTKHTPQPLVLAPRRSARAVAQQRPPGHACGGSKRRRFAACAGNSRATAPTPVRHPSAGRRETSTCACQLRLGQHVSWTCATRQLRRSSSAPVMSAGVGESTSPVAGDAAQGLKIFVRNTDGSSYPCDVTPMQTVRCIKGLVEQQCSVAASEMRLIYRGRVLGDAETVLTLGLADGHSLHLSVRPAGVCAHASSPWVPAQPTRSRLLRRQQTRPSTKPPPPPNDNCRRRAAAAPRRRPASANARRHRRAAVA